MHPILKPGPKLSQFATALLLMAAPALAQASELLNVYHLAVENDTTLAAAEFSRQASLEARPQARAGLLPSLSGSYSYRQSASKGSSRSSSFQSDDLDGDGQPDPGSERLVVNNRPSNSKSSSRSLGVNLSQPVFDWVAFLNYDQSADQVALAESSYRSQQQLLILRSAQAYFDYLAANDSLRNTQTQHESIGRQLDQAKKRFEVGLAPVTDVQEAQASYDLNTANILVAEQALAAAREALLEITGQREAPLVPLRDEIPLPGPQPADVNAWLAAANDNNLDLAAARINVLIAERSVKIAKAGHLPTVDFSASYGNSNSESEGRGAASGQSSKSQTDSNNVGLSLNLPIFSGFSVRSRTRQAFATAEQRKVEQEGVRRSVSRQTRDAYLGVLSGASQVRALKQAVISNKTALDASQTGLQVGTRTSVDVLNAQSLYFSAQQNLARARYDYLLSILTLKQASGRLSEADLEEIDRLLDAG